MKKTLFLFPLVAIAASVAVGCGDEGTAAPEVDYSALLKDVSEQVALPAHRAGAEKADALLAALRTLETAPSADALQSAQNAWREARAAYRRMDPFNGFGPVPELAIDVRIDASPADPGGIEQTVASADPISADYVGRLGGKKKGFLAVEYLLFKANGDVLAGFTPGGRRGVLARALGEEIATTMHQLLDAWDPAKGGQGKDLTEAGKGGKYASQLAAIDNLVGGGAFTLELVVGARLALPLGRKSKSGTPDAAQDPTLASDNAVADMAASMAGVQSLYQSPGFTTLIRPKLQELDDKAVAEMNTCMAKINAIPRPFGTSVTQNTAVVQEAFEACKAFKLTWNTDVTSTLGANVKPLDTDGD